MISAEQRAHIRRLFFAEHWKIGTIAAELGVHHDTVELAIDLRCFVNIKYRQNESALDAYKGFVRDTLEQYPKLRATRLLEMIRTRGYAGSVYQLRRYVSAVRPVSRHEAFFRLTVLPGEQGQADWASFGKIPIGKTLRALSCFVMVLAWSRATYARFVLDQTLESFVRCIVRAFESFGGVPRDLLVDNLKSAVLERQGDLIRFHPRLLDLAGYYHFACHPVAPARGNEKGRVERRIRDIREAFFEARRFHDVDDLNRQLVEWIASVAHARLVPGNTDGLTVAAALDQERAHLLPLPEHPFTGDLIRATASGKTPYLRFDANDYSIPHTLIRKPLTLVVSDTTIRILDGTTEVARHDRSWDRGRQVEDVSHLDGLARDKKKAREHRGRNRLFAACPAAEPFLAEIALHGGHLGGTTSRLLHLLDQYGGPELDHAIRDAHGRGAFAAHSVAHILDQRRHARGEPARVEVVLPDDPRVRDLVVRPHALDSYDRIARSNDQEDDLG